MCLIFSVSFAQMLLHKFAWNDYFTGTPVTTLNSSEYSSGQTPSVASVCVSNCLFNKCTNSNTGGGGGALYCTSVTYLYVETSSFFSCKVYNGPGGAINFCNPNNGQCVLYKVCGYDCCSTTTIGQFVRIYIYNVASSKNYVNYTSTVRCVCDTSGSCETLCLEYGKIYCPSVNVSMNLCKYYSGLFCYPVKDSNAATCSLLYCAFVDNKATQYNCIYFRDSGVIYEIKCCNILRNTQGTLSSSGTIYTSGSLNIEDSCILENEATYIFYSSSSCTITLSNCTVDKTSKTGNLVTRNTVTKSFILGLNHMSTRNCHSEYDSAGTLTAISSASTKKEFCYTCKKK
jgi:hypothetical protein